MDVASEGELAFALAAGVPGERADRARQQQVRRATSRRRSRRGPGLVVVDHTAELAPDRGARGRRRAHPGRARAGHARHRGRHAPQDRDRPRRRRSSACRRPRRSRRCGSRPALEHVRPAGLHVHLGSQIRDVGTYLEAAAWLAGFIAENGLGGLPVLDLGGGLAIAYTDADRVARRARRGRGDGDRRSPGCSTARGLPLPELILEPGRSIAGPAGVTLYTVGAIKRTDAGRHLRRRRRRHGRQPPPGDVRGALPGVRGRSRGRSRRRTPTRSPGKHCESGDVLIEAAALPELRPGDVIALAATGAYTATMSSTYNGLPRPAAVMVADGARAHRGRPRDRRRPARTRARRRRSVLEQADVLGLGDGLGVAEAVDEQVARLAPRRRVDERPGDRLPRRDRHPQQVARARSPWRRRG